MCKDFLSHLARTLTVKSRSCSGKNLLCSLLRSDVTAHIRHLSSPHSAIRDDMACHIASHSSPPFRLHCSTLVVPHHPSVMFHYLLTRELVDYKEVLVSRSLLLLFHVAFIGEVSVIKTSLLVPVEYLISLP